MGILENAYIYRPLLHLIIPVMMFVLGLVGALLASVDVSVAALCEGGDKCSLVINLSSIKSATAALGTMFMTPWVGSLSDKYGRRPFFMILFTIFAVPNVILAISTSKTAVYTYFVVGTIVLMLGEGSLSTLFYAFVADTIPGPYRSTAFGFVGAILSLGFMAGTIVARLIPGQYIFHSSVVCSTLAVLYIVFVMPESLPSIAKKNTDAIGDRSSNEPLLEPKSKPSFVRSPSTVKDTLSLIKNSRLLTVIVTIAFLSNLADVGLQGNILYFLKAAFHWNKDDFAVLMLIIGLMAAVGQIFVLPTISSFFKPKIVLLVGLFCDSLHIIALGLAWAPWVVFTSAFFSCFSGIASPVISSIVSNSGTASDQGLLQGVVSAIKSLSSIVSSIVINQITAKFLSDSPPFSCLGFGLVVAGLVQAVSFFLAFSLPNSTSISKEIIPNEEAKDVEVPEQQDK